LQTSHLGHFADSYFRTRCIDISFWDTFQNSTFGTLQTQTSHLGHFADFQFRTLIRTQLWNNLNAPKLIWSQLWTLAAPMAVRAVGCNFGRWPHI
jgi:hypothetical protein